MAFADNPYDVRAMPPRAAGWVACATSGVGCGGQAPGKPSLSGFSISPAVFRADNAGPTIGLTKPTGSRIRHIRGAAGNNSGGGAGEARPILDPEGQC